MLSAYIDSYGGVKKTLLGSLEIPQVGENQVLVKVKASSINPADLRIREGVFKIFTGKKFPLVLGLDYSGVVEKSNNSNFNPGDEVYGFVSTVKPRTWAEYALVEENEIALKPKNLSFDDSACLPLVASTAYQALTKAGIKEGQEVLINGAGGGVGSMAIQLAKSLGANITGVCSSSKKEMIKELGANKVVDYTQEEIKGKYDIILDTVGNLNFKQIKKNLTKKGTFVTLAPSVKKIIRSNFNFITSKKLLVVMVKPEKKSLNKISELVEKEKLKPVLWQKYRLDEIQEAQEKLLEGGASGKIVIKIAE